MLTFLPLALIQVTLEQARHDCDDYDDDDDDCALSKHCCVSDQLWLYCG